MLRANLEEECRISARLQAELDRTKGGSPSQRRGPAWARSGLSGLVLYYPDACRNTTGLTTGLLYMLEHHHVAFETKTPEVRLCGSAPIDCSLAAASLPTLYLSPRRQTLAVLAPPSLHATFSAPCLHPGAASLRVPVLCAADGAARRRHRARTDGRHHVRRGEGARVGRRHGKRGGARDDGHAQRAGLHPYTPTPLHPCSRGCRCAGVQVCGCAGVQRPCIPAAALHPAAVHAPCACTGHAVHMHRTLFTCTGHCARVAEAQGEQGPTAQVAGRARARASRGKRRQSAGAVQCYEQDMRMSMSMSMWEWAEHGHGHGHGHRHRHEHGTARARDLHGAGRPGYDTAQPRGLTKGVPTASLTCACILP